MSPLTGSENLPCPHLVEQDDMKICDTYNQRPEQCRNHEFPAKFCPVGMDVLGISRDDAAARVQTNDWKLYARPKA